MSGLFPNPDDGGVAPGLTTPPSYAPDVSPIGTLARYFSDACGVRVRAEVLNAILSQIVATIDFVKLAYDPTRGHIDMSLAIQYYLQQNRGAFAEAADGPVDYTATGAPEFMGYELGQVLWLLMPPATPSAANARLNVDGKGFKNILRFDGSPTEAGDLPAGTIVGLAFRNNAWQMVSGGTDFMSVARARLPIYPHVNTTLNTFGVSSPMAGQVLVPAGVQFIHRGIYADNTDNYSAPSRTLATLASKTYHARWTYGVGFELKDLADPLYNPTAPAEDSPVFDSIFDSMLLARVVTNGANASTIVELANAFRRATTISRAASVGAPSTTVYPVNFARVPDTFLRNMLPPGNMRDTDYDIRVTQKNRYQVTVYSESWHDAPTNNGSPGYLYDVVMPGGA